MGRSLLFATGVGLGLALAGALGAAVAGCGEASSNPISPSEPSAPGDALQVVIVEATTETPPNSIGKAAEVLCPEPGMVVLGGGAEIRIPGALEPGTPVPLLFSSRPRTGPASGHEGWSAVASTADSKGTDYAQGWALHVWAICGSF